MAELKDLSSALDRLWKQYRELMFTRLRVLDEAISAVETGRPDPKLNAEAESAAHKLAGSLGTFGLESGTRDAAAIEQFFSPDGERDAATPGNLRALFDSVSQAISAKDELQRRSR